MKNNKIVIGIIIIFIFAIVTVFGLLIYQLINKEDIAQTNSNVEENSRNNQLENTQVEKNNEKNQTVLEPIITPTIPNENESTVSRYYYSQLDETGKKLYDGLQKNKENLKSGNYTIDYGTQFNTLLNTDGGEEKFNQAFQSAWNAFSYDNVDLFYINVSKLTLKNEYTSLGGIKTYKISIGPGNNENYLKNTFKNKQEVENAKNYLENIKKQMIEQTASDDDYTKISKVHNWIIYFADYQNDENAKDKNTIYGTLKNGKAVCEGYARTFKYLMDGVGVPCLLISGTATNSQGQTESHAWNYVQINDTWYAIDVTWDDPVVTGGEQTDEMRKKYFLKGSEEFFKDHREDGKISEQSISFKFPILSKLPYEGR